MCGRFTLRTPANVLIQHFGLHGEMQLSLRYNIAPTQQVAVIRHNGDGREFSTMRWVWCHHGPTIQKSAKS
jgi:putative SOS response-associated peptidase YedK